MRSPIRKSVKTPGDMVRRARQFLKAARTLLIEARDSHYPNSALYRELNYAQSHLWDEAARATRLGAECDAERARLRAEHAKQAKRRAA